MNKCKLTYKIIVKEIGISKQSMRNIIRSELKASWWCSPYLWLYYFLHYNSTQSNFEQRI